MTGDCGGRALVALGNLLILRGDLAEAEVRLSEGHRLATDADDAVVLARALAGEGYLKFRRSHLAEAQAVWQEALKIAQHAGGAVLLGGYAVAAVTAGTIVMQRRDIT